MGLLHLCMNNQRGWATANASRWSCGFGNAKEKLGFGMFLIWDSRSGDLRHVKCLRSWVLKVGSRRDASTVDASGALQCWLLQGLVLLDQSRACDLESDHLENKWCCSALGEDTSGTPCFPL